MVHGPSGLGGNKPVALGAAAEAPAKPSEGHTITVPDRWGDSHLQVTVHPVKGGKTYKTQVSALGAKLLHTARANRPGTEEYYTKLGFVRVKTQDGVAYLSPNEFQKAVDAGVKWLHINVEDAVELAKMDQENRQQQDAATAAKQSAQTLKKKGLHGSQKAGHRGPRNLEEYKAVLQKGIDILELPPKKPGVKNR